MADCPSKYWVWAPQYAAEEAAKLNAALLAEAVKGRSDMVCEYDVKPEDSSKVEDDDENLVDKTVFIR